MHTYRYPYYGNARGGTNRYEMGGFAYGGWQGLGDGGTTTPTAVAMIPEPRPIPTEMLAMPLLDRNTYAVTLQAQARQAQANAIVAAMTGNPGGYATSQAAATAMATQARDVAAGAAPAGGRHDTLPPTASPKAVAARSAALARGGKPGGMGRGIPWAGKTRNEKATTVVAGGAAAGAAWWMLLL